MKQKKFWQKIIVAALNKSFKDGKLQTVEVKKYFKLFSKLPRILAIYALGEYLKGLKRVERKHTLLIESATSLSALEVKQVANLFKQEKIVDIKIQIDSSLIGGIKVKFGDLVFDDSIKVHLNQIKGVING